MQTGKIRTAVTVAVLAVLVSYLAGYAWLRLHHDFVHDATFYTDFDGKVVHTDYVRVGECDVTSRIILLDAAYQPLLWGEGVFWRAYKASQDGGIVGSGGQD